MQVKGRGISSHTLGVVTGSRTRGLRQRSACPNGMGQGLSGMQGVRRDEHALKTGC